MKIRRILSIILAAVLALSLVACGNGTESSQTNSSSQTATASSTESTSPATSTANTSEPATKFPEKALEIIVGFAAGGGNHLAAENLTNEAQDVFGVPMTVTCMPGAGSAVANSYVVSQPSDGYTLLNGTTSLPISMYMGTVDFKKEDFVGVACFSEVTPCFVVRADLPADNLQELVQYCNDNPGSFSWGHSGVGGNLQLAGCHMLNKMGILDKVKEVPFSGTNEAVAQVLGGHLDAVISFASTVQEQVRAGNLKVLAVSGNERVPEFPDTPTCVEQGYDAVLTSTRGIFVRSDTPAEVVAVLEAGFAEIVQSDAFRERAEALGEPPVYMNSKDFTQLYYEQCDMISALIEELGLNQ